MFKQELFYGRVLQIIAVTTVSLSLISDGMQYGWSSPINVILKSPSSPVPVQDSDLIWLENVYTIGGLLGIVLTTFMLDKCGRKGTILILSAINIISWILTACAASVGVLYAARFFFGTTAYINFTAISVYTAEIADKEIRGRLGTLTTILTIVGSVLIYAVGPFVSIALSSTIGALIVVLQLLTFCFMPESPYYYLIRNKKDDAQKALQKFRRTNDIEDELNEIAEAIEKENAERGGPTDLFTIKSNRNACLILMFLSLSEPFCGVTVFVMNTHMILEDANVALSTNTGAILLSIFGLVAAIVAIFLIDSVGRRYLLWSSSFLTGLTLFVLAFYYAAKNEEINIESYTWVPIVALILHSLTYAYGLGIVPLVMVSELFPTNIKAIGISVISISFAIGSVISIYLFHYLQHLYGMHVPFFLFGVCAIITGLFSIFFVPETKGISLEEIQHLLKGKSAINDNKSTKENGFKT